MAKLEKERATTSARWTFWYKDPVLAVAVGLVFSLDQITKAVVRHSLVLGESVPREGLVRITRTFNTGSAFGLFPDQSLMLIVASFVGMAVLLLVYRNHPLRSASVRLALGMQMGGALGNLADRLRMGRVTDFVDLGFWPIFNLADAAIVVGIIVIASVVLTGGGKSGPAPSTGYSGAGVAGGRSAWWRRLGRPAGPPDAGPSWEDNACPICDSAMDPVPGGWRCSGCGVKERLDDRGAR